MIDMNTQMARRLLSRIEATGTRGPEPGVEAGVDTGAEAGVEGAGVSSANPIHEGP